MNDACKTIKERIDCIEWCRRQNIPIYKSGDRCVSPLRPGANNKTAFVCYHDFFYDFVSRQGGDVIDLCALLRHNGDRRAAIRELARLTGTEQEPTQDWMRATNSLNNRIQKWHEALLASPEHLEYLHARRITDDTISSLKIGYTGRGEPDGYCARRIAPIAPVSAKRLFEIIPLALKLIFK